MSEATNAELAILAAVAPVLAALPTPVTIVITSLQAGVGTGQIHVVVTTRSLPSAAMKEHLLSLGYPAPPEAP